MKHKFRALTLVLVLALLLTACSSPSPDEVVSEESVPLPEKVEETAPANPEIAEFFSKYVDTDTRPIAVMVDNDNDQARPHAGLDEAYLIYEIIIEGGATRFMALYRNADTEAIGPVRSSRHYFLDYLMENDAIYTHYGWSPQAQSDIESFKINKINGVLGGDDKIFWRDRKYTKAWHSAYTKIENILDMAKKKGYADKTEHKNAISYTDSYFDLDTDASAMAVSLKYSDLYTTGYTYNEDTLTYEKTINRKPHLMQNGNTLTVKNILIQLISDTSLGDGSDRRNINTTGSGKGYYITNGKYEEITWEKASRKANTIYKKADGTPLELNPGKTIVNIISPSAKITIE